MMLAKRRTISESASKNQTLRTNAQKPVRSHGVDDAFQIFFLVGWMWAR